MSINNLKSVNFNSTKLYRTNNVSFQSGMQTQPMSQPVENVQMPSYYIPVQMTTSTQLRTPQEMEMFQALYQVANPKSKKALERLLKSGALLSNNSNDKSTTLENLCKIFITPRIIGLSPAVIFNDTVQRLDNPHLITQHFGDIPKNVMPYVIRNENAYNAQNSKDGKFEMITPKSFDINSSSCVAASIEFNLAQKQPAEFARMINDLSSEKYSTNKRINLNSLSKNSLEALWLLKEFNADYKLQNHDYIDVKLSPDRNAIIRARIQTVYKDPLERSAVDVLMQSTFMNTGAQKSYNSLTDTRIGKYNSDNKGLTDLEKNVTEVLATGKKKISVTYQQLDENGKITGYECDFKTMRQQITDAIKMGENVVIGYTYTDNKNVVIGGHEITITGIKTDKNGVEYFVCNDTDDDKAAPVYYQIDEFLPKIHHAGLPMEALKEDVEFVDNWQEILKELKPEKKKA